MRNYILYACLCAIISLPFQSFAAPGAGWKMVFEDEFEGSELDLTKWNYNYTWGQTHNHRAYVDKSQVSVSDGKLKLTAIAERHPDAPHGTDKWYDQFGYIPFDYTSGAVNTNGKFNFTYGYVEGRFKMAGSGTWPAFWALNGGGEWPPEIDILEVPHSRNDHHYYYHFGPDWQNEQSFGGVHKGPDKSAGFHDYGVEWGPDYMYFYFDGQRVASYNNRPDCSQGKNMFLIINLAVGGWAGDPSENDVFPSVFECDWVRVWQPDLNNGNWDFELGELGQWGKWNNVAVTEDCSRSGDYGLRLENSPASSERLIEVKPNTSYLLEGWAQVLDPASYTVFGVKNHGAAEQRVQITSADWEQKSLMFTTGADAATARIYFYQSAGTGVACADDFKLVEAVPDCMGEIGGSAYIDYCGTCVGGNTGLEACPADKLEAELLCGFNGIVETTNSGFSGNGYVNIAMEAGAAIDFSVQSAEDAQAVLTVRYANGAAGNRDCALYLNGQLHEQTLAFPSTGNWSKWDEISLTVKLGKGENNLRLVAIAESGGPDFDFFVLTGIESYYRCGSQNVSLKQGWNLVSFFVDTELLLDQLVDAGVSTVKNESAFYSAGYPDYLQSLNKVELNEAYLVYAEADATIVLDGKMIEKPPVKPLRTGWNWVPVGSDETVEHFMEQYPQKATSLKNFNGFYSNSTNLNSLHELRTGDAVFMYLEP